MLQLAAKGKDLHARRKNKSKRKLDRNLAKAIKRTDVESAARAREELVEPTLHVPTRTLLRGNYGYYAFTPSHTVVHAEDAIEDLHLQINALTLTVGELHRMIDRLGQGAVPVGMPVPRDLKSAITQATVDTAATAFDGTVIPMSNVITMAAQSERNKKRVSHALPVPGNEAEALEPGEGGYLLAAPAGEITGNVVSIVNSTKPPANEAHVLHREDELEPVELVQTNRGMNTDGRASPILDMIERKFGFSKMEMYKMAKKEHKRRDVHCRAHHNGVGYDTLRKYRSVLQSSAVGSFWHMYQEHYWYGPSMCRSGYAQFNRKVEAMDVESMKIRGRMERYDDDQTSYAIAQCNSDLMKVGIPIHKARRELLHKDNLKAGSGGVGQAWRAHRRSNLHHLAETARANREKPMSQLSVYRRTMQGLAADWKYTKMGWRDSLAKLGIKPDWFAGTRAKAQVMHDLDNVHALKSKEDAAKQASMILKHDSETPMGDVVREVTRRGVSY